MAIRYVDTAGLGGSPSNGNPGTITSPWLTLSYAAAQLNPGDTCWVRGGTYTGSANNIDATLTTVNGGTSSLPILIAAYVNGGTLETVAIQSPDGTNTINLTSATQTWLTFQDFILDGSLESNTNIQGIDISGTASNITINLCTVRNYPNFGMQFSNNNGAATNLLIYGCSVHGNGSGSLNTNGHGIYNTGASNVTTDTCQVYNNLGYGLHNYESDGLYNISGCVTRNNSIFNNGRTSGSVTSYGIVDAGGNGNLYYNNLIYGNYGGISIYSYSEACGVYNNTIYNNNPGAGWSNGGLDCQYYSSSPTATNNIIYLNASGINDYGGLSGALIQSHNWTSNPTFVNPGANDYRLQSTSGAIAYGANLGSIFTTDLLGITRGVPWTAGAYQYVGAGVGGSVGGATVTGVSGSGTGASVGTASGAATVTGHSAAIAASVGSAAGVGTAMGRHGQPGVTIGINVELNGMGNGWTNVVGDLCDTPMTTRRGFQSGNPDDLVAAPGTWTFVLDNSAHNSGSTLGYYSVDSASCRTGWNLGIRAQLTCTLNVLGGTYTRFQGWVDVITPLSGLYEDQTVAVTVVGWLAHALGTGITAIQTPITQRGDQLVGALQALVTFQPPSVAFAQGIDTYPLAFDDLDLSRSTVVDGLDYVTRSGFDRVFEQANGTLVFESRATRQATVSTYTALLNDVPGANALVIMTKGLGCARTRAALLNRFEITVHPREVDLVPVILASSPITASSPAIPPGTSLTVQLPYVDPSQLAQSVGGYNMRIASGGGDAIGTSGSLPVQDWAFTTSPSGLGQSMNGAMTVTVVYAATQATITATNFGTVMAYVSLLQVRGQGIYDYLDVVGLANQTTSQVQFGQTVYPVDCPYQVVPQFAQLAANWCAANYAATVSQIDKVSCFFMNTDETLLALAFTLDISSPIAVTETMTGLTGAPFWLNGESMEIDARGNITITYQVVPMLQGFFPWLLGVSGRSDLGVDTIVGYF